MKPFRNATSDENEFTDMCTPVQVATFKELQYLSTPSRPEFADRPFLPSFPLTLLTMAHLQTRRQLKTI